MNSTESHTLLDKIKRRIVQEIHKAKNRVSVGKLLKTLLYQANFYKLTKKELLGINLGSGHTPIPEFLNIDTDWAIASDVVGTVEKLKVANNKVGTIYTSHLFEHTNRTRSLKILEEWHRALISGGTLYIAVPDLEKLFQIYLENIASYEDDEARARADKACRIIYGGQTNAFDYHYYGYSFVTLKYLLERVGFQKIERFDPRLEHVVPENSDSSFASISLNIRATK